MDLTDEQWVMIEPLIPEQEPILLAVLIAYCHQPNKPSIQRNGRPQFTILIPN